MKHILLFFVLIFVFKTNTLIAQNSLATYTYKMIEDEFEHSGKLIFNSNTSKFVYKQIEGTKYIIEEDDGFLTQTIYSDSAGHVFYRDKTTMKMKERTFVESNAFLLEDDFKLAWRIEKRTKDIASYKCYRASTTFRGREYIAWFSPDIPFDVGPWKFNGLPGMILEVSDKENLVYFKVSALSLSNSSSKIGFDYLGEFVSYEDLRSRQLTIWKRRNEMLKSKAARMMAASPGLEIEIELPNTPVYTEKFSFEN
ncbi:MAG: hypothetical protein COW03_15065 [Cytophagales bacterium CG12_big_fil_rev_8_21_14_0_65_40_12]|nr:MAG: hypothetical protein COW03_15065 [Cytophagales bacterium CG12_big_fil_rev_8_21_14_0_65_40_12]PIW05176.1 MAG: hypothetical protein COW40_05865 [Cytophagales bacterium CG17_big_fil_post_rev_8_21_14_2_50_40_13]